MKQGKRDWETETKSKGIFTTSEEEGLKQEAKEIVVKLTSEVGFYILNRKRDTLNGMEQRYEFQITLQPDEKLL